MMRSDSYASTCAVRLPQTGAPYRSRVQAGDMATMHRGGWVRVHAPPGRIRFWLSPDDGIPLGPFDGPALATVEGPCRVDLERYDTLPLELAVTVSWGPGAVVATADRQVSLDAGTPEPLNPWERWVTIETPVVTGSWLDAASIVIDTIPPLYRSRRPPDAVSFSLAADGRARIDTWP